MGAELDRRLPRDRGGLVEAELDRRLPEVRLPELPEVDPGSPEVDPGSPEVGQRSDLDFDFDGSTRWESGSGCSSRDLSDEDLESDLGSDRSRALSPAGVEPGRRKRGDRGTPGKKGDREGFPTPALSPKRRAGLGSYETSPRGVEAT